MATSEQFLLSFEARARLLSEDEIFAGADGNLLRVLREDRRIERKPAGVQRNFLAEYFSMWANTPPYGGVIVIGVENDGQITGILSSSTAHVNELEKAGFDCCPDAKNESRRVPVTTKTGLPDQILLIRVFYHEEKVVKTTSGDAFVRRGESKCKLRDHEIRELQIEKGEVSWEREQTALSYPEDFDAKSIARFAASVIEGRKLEHVSSSEQILSQMHLGRFSGGRFSPNKACSLLFGGDPRSEVPGCFIRFQRFDGKEELFGDKRNQIKDEWIIGNLPYQLEQAERLIGAQLREFSRLGTDGKFITTQEYPKAAWLEAVVNAVGHRSYGISNVSIFVKMFDDRLEVESPGGFMPFVTPENIYERSDARNPGIMEALFFWDRTKWSNEGTRRMRQTMQEFGLPEPIFQGHKDNPKVTVTLKNNVEHRKVWLDSDVSRLIGEGLFRLLSEHDKRVVNYVGEFGKISVTDTIRITDKAWDTCKSLLERLCQLRILRHVHRKDILRDPKAHYVLVSAPAKPN